MKAKGSNAERDLVAKFWEHGLAALRIAGSGSMKYPSCDILAADGSMRFAVECKATKKDYQYVTSEQLNDLVKFAAMFSAVPVIAVKFSNKWRFYHPDKIRKTKSGRVAINKKEEFKTFVNLISGDITSDL